MILSEINYNQDQELFLNYLDKIGVVLETVILELSELPNNIYLISENATIKGMEILADRHEKWFKKHNPEVDIRDYFNIRILPDEEITGKKITFSNFIGDGYDLRTETIGLFSYDTGKVIYQKVNQGFAHALLNPPHSLRFKRYGKFADEEYAESESQFLKGLIQSYFKTILNVVRESDIDFLAIISWSDNWTNYFEAGKEWWGTFCCTIYDERNNAITFIAASSTD